MHTEESLQNYLESKIPRNERGNSSPREPRTAPAPPVERNRLRNLDQVLKPFQWSRSCANFFETVIKDAPLEARISSIGLDSQWFFLQLLIHGARNPPNTAYSTVNLFKASGLSLEQLAKLQNEIQGRGSSRLMELQSKIEGRREKGLSEIQLLPELADILTAAGELGRRIGEDKVTAIRHLVAAFIFRTTQDGRLLSYLGLERSGIPLDKLLKAFRSHIEEPLDDKSPETLETWKRAVDLINNALIGQQMRFNREASAQEGVLEVDRYAEVLARLMRQADDREFNLAVYGHWGRGKTYLMRRTAEALRTRPAADPREFEAVAFSAWQYPSRPEVWIYLYETFAKAAFDSGTWKSLPNIVRTGIVLHGYWKFLFALFLGAAALIPLPTQLAWLHLALWQYYLAVGAAGFLLTCAFYKAVTGTYKRLKAHYLVAPSHSEKLGLQATIGKDLAALLTGWLPVRGMDGLFYAGFFTISIFASGILWWRIRHDWGQQDPRVAVGAAVLLFLLALFLCQWLFPWRPKRKKILLIVDDLDRCDPDHLLSVMESLKLMLENPEICRRVQVAMLIEEDILRHAIWRKYGYLANKDASSALGTNFNGERITRENFEKLFTVHLRLPPLEPAEIAVVVKKFASPDAAPTPHSMPVDPAKRKASPSMGAANAADIQKETKPAKLYLDKDETAAITLLAANEIVLSDDERAAIGDELGRTREGSDHIAPLGPRAIRAFIFRYQLVRLILTTRGIAGWQPQAVIAALARSLFQGSDSQKIHGNLIPEVAAVVRQVS